MRTPFTFVLVWVGAVLISLCGWYLAIVTAVWVADQWVTWPAVKLASAVAVFGVGVFLIGEQFAEMQVNARARGGR